MSDGCEQRERHPAALRAGTLRVDELRLEDRLAMAAAQAAQLRFVDLALRDAGDWGKLFEGDESLVLARLASLDLGTRQAEFLSEADSAPAARLVQHSAALVRHLDALVTQLELTGQAAAKALADHLRQRVQRQLAGDVSALFAADDPARARLDPGWFAATPRSRSVEADERGERARLRATFFALLHALTEAQAMARELLPDSLKTKAHAPAAGLLLAVAQLYETVQRRINRFTERHVDFYYHDCLGLTPNPATPDRVHLVCTPDPRAAHDALIAPGTVFLAGKDAAGTPVRFAADQGLHVSDARVVSLCTLKLERDALISPEREFGQVTRAKARRVDAATAGRALPGALLPHQPLFGGTQPGAATTAADDAAIGLAFASPLWALDEGERTIRIALRFEPPGAQDAASAPLLRRLAAEPAAAAEVLPALFARYLALEPQPGADAAALAQRALARLARRGNDTEAALDPYTLFVSEQAIGAGSSAVFHERLGRLFGHWLLADAETLAEADLAALRNAARPHVGPEPLDPLSPANPLCLVHGRLRPERDLLFERIFQGVFDVGLTTASGWLDAPEAYVARGPVDGVGRGLEVILRLRPQDPPIVALRADLHPPPPGTAWPVALPMVRLLLNARGRLFPYSLLERLRLREARLAVAVRGVRQVTLHNQLGRVDPAKPFQPFGPLPAVGNYLVFGAPELAVKKLDTLSLRIEWSGLPPDDGGFARWYDGYGADEHHGDCRATLAILRDGQWQPCGGAPGGQPLFRQVGPLKRLDPHATIELDPGSLQRFQRASTEMPDYGVEARQGYFRLLLAGPPGAFGHAAYPSVLTEVVSANARHRRQRPLPNAPYTPVIERLTLDYSAHATLRFGQPATAGAELPERVLHLHPFGMETILPDPGNAPRTLLPRQDHDGNLHIGVQAKSLRGPLTLYFHLRDETAAEPLPGMDRPRVHWAVLGSNRWHALTDAQVLSDTTDGFLTSGIVTLDLPPLLDRRNTLLPDDCHWLRVSADSGFHLFAGLHGVHAQALTATRVLDADAATPVTLLPAGSVTQAQASVVGLAGVTQIAPSFGLRAAEDRDAWCTRAGERLRHKQRAVQPWDYERLVLEHFPEVFKVKCFPHTSTARAAPSPGDVLVVVVPDAPRNAAAERTRGVRLNAVVLHRIRDFLAALAPPGVRVSVRNAAYERIQVRCTLRLARHAHPGVSIQRVNDAIIDQLSPWVDGGYGARFDWLVRGEDIETRLRRLDCVDFVTKLSLLHIARSDQGVYTLADTARAGAGARRPSMAGSGAWGPAAAGDEVRRQAAHLSPISPWSLVLPTRTHIVDTTEAFSSATPDPTGIARLAIGATFIVGRSSHAQP